MAVTRKVKKKTKIKGKVKSKPNVVLPGPDELNEPPEELFAYPILLFGEKGAGKTSLLAQIPDSVIFQFDPKRVNLPIRQVPRKGDPALDWPTFMEYVEQAIADDSVACLGIDNFERCYRACLNYGCYQRGISSPNEAKDYGATWHEIRAEFEACMWSIQDSGKSLITTAHGRMKTVEARDGDNYDQCVPAVSEYVFEFIKECFDFAFYLGLKQGRRTLYLRHTDLIWAACGTKDRFMDAKVLNEETGEPAALQYLSLEPDPETAYENILKGFANELTNERRRPKKRRTA